MSKKTSVLNPLVRLWRMIRREWAKWSQPGTGGLTQRGDWRCWYEPNEHIAYPHHTRWMSYGEAATCQELWGGHLEWRYDEPAHNPGKADHPAVVQN